MKIPGFPAPSHEPKHSAGSEGSCPKYSSPEGDNPSISVGSVDLGGGPEVRKTYVAGHKGDAGAGMGEGVPS